MACSKLLDVNSASPNLFASIAAKQNTQKASQYSSLDIYIP